MKFLSSAAILLFISFEVFSQTPSWHTLPNSPIPDSISGRFEDMFFASPTSGWVIEYSGKIFHTSNGGNSWSTQFISPYYPNDAFRSIGFADSLHGWMGTLDSIHYILYSTTNGGLNWNPVQNIPTNIKANGICGMSVVNSSVMYGAGIWYGPPTIIKTTNAGLNWTVIDMSTYAHSLIDCRFTTQDSGIVVGGIGSSSSNEHGVVLFTSNGGNNWVTRFTTSDNNNFCWKISFPTASTGYVSLEKFLTGAVYFLKTTNGGVNWSELLFTSTYYDEEGIGFVNANTGWIGGYGTGNPGPGPTYETTNGGNSWHLAGWGLNINRLRFLSDTIGYAAGSLVYKYTKEPIGIQPISTEVPKQFSLHQNYPNPFNPETKIRFEIPAGVKRETSNVKMVIYNAIGKEIAILVNEQLKAGVYEINWNGFDYPSGVYFYKLQTESYSESKKLILLK